jgi:hypothetical protein
MDLGGQKHWRGKSYIIIHKHFNHIYIYRVYIVIHKPCNSGQHIYIQSPLLVFPPLRGIFLTYSHYLVPKMFTIIDLYFMPSVVPGLAPDTTARFVLTQQVYEHFALSIIRIYLTYEGSDWGKKGQKASPSRL